MYSAEFQRCLIELDIDGIIRVWQASHPMLAVEGSRHDVLVSLHMARTVAISIPLKLRAYSHRWLLDYGYPSQLPDRLKPHAERMYPQNTKAVGISVNSKYPVVQTAIHNVMRDAVLEAYADGHQDDPETVRKRMMEARRKEQRGLGL
jgi:hypothetical protein